MTTPESGEKSSKTENEVVLEAAENEPTKAYQSDGLVKSTLDDLSIPRTLWVFRRVSLVALAVYTGYICEGFEAR